MLERIDFYYRKNLVVANGQRDREERVVDNQLLDLGFRLDVVFEVFFVLGLESLVSLEGDLPLVNLFEVRLVVGQSPI